MRLAPGQSVADRGEINGARASERARPSAQRQTPPSYLWAAPQQAPDYLPIQAGQSPLQKRGLVCLHELKSVLRPVHQCLPGGGRWGQAVIVVLHHH